MQDDFTSEDFAHMSAPLLFRMFKSKTGFPLHAAVRLQREDVVFLYLVENSTEVSTVSNADSSKEIKCQLSEMCHQPTQWLSLTVE